MGFRSRLKNRLKSLLGQDQETAPAASKPPPPPPPKPDKPLNPVNPPPPEKVTTTPPKVPPKAAAPASEKTAPLSEDKVARHRERTRKGLLKKTLESGGTIGLGELHDHSERRFFVGHKAFSDMMEDLVRENLLLFDWDAQEATLTDAGRQYLDES